MKHDQVEKISKVSELQSVGIVPATNQGSQVAKGTARTMGTKTDEMRSAMACIGALLICARSTSLTICASVV